MVNPTILNETTTKKTIAAATTIYNIAGLREDTVTMTPDKYCGFERRRKKI